MTSTRTESTVALETTWLSITWPDGTLSRFHYLWLRDNCLQRLHATTKHRVDETSLIPGDVRPETATMTAEGALRVQWAHDQHISEWSMAWLRAHDYSNGTAVERPLLTLWDVSMAAEIPHADYPSLLEHGENRIEFLDGFLRYGLGILHNVPAQSGAVLEVAQEFGEVRTTSWGTVFDVVSMAEANSVAYTNLPLVTHTDEGYRDPAPTVQLQHFIQADATGGESTLVDGFRIAADIRAENPEAFRLLATVEHRFHFADATAEHEHIGSVIELDGSSEVRAIRYSNHSVTPFLVPFETMPAYYDAYRTFGRMRESDQYQLRIPMGPGDLYMVDNRRVMHGRTGFSSGGARHLQSCYIERDELASKLTVLKRTAAS
jgi:gamma-butyrobetaine hydroxylase